MQMRIQQDPDRPVQIWVQGVIHPEDLPVLRPAWQKLLRDVSGAQALWLHLEPLRGVNHTLLEALHEFALDCRHHGVQLLLIVRHKGNALLLQNQGFQVHYQDPDPILEKANVF